MTTPTTAHAERINKTGVPVQSAKFENEGILAHAFQNPSVFSRAHSYKDLKPTLSINLDDLQAGTAVESGTARLERILQLLPSGVILLDSRGIVVDCNPAAIELLGVDIKGVSWRQVITEQFHPQLDDGHEISLKNGSRVSLLTRSLGNEPGQIIVLNDLTETRRLQQQLSRHQRLSAMGKMVSSLAHQIRTPLSAALLYADKLRIAESSDYATARVSGKILSRLQNIERQIRDMLIFARGESELTERLSINELAFQIKEAACDIPHPATPLLQWQVDDCDLPINCNADALTGAVVNLIENALQASGEDKAVTIEIGLQAQNSSCLCICVKDTGHGINEELLANLEEPFVTTKSQGTGLGLAIVKLVAQAHRGSFQITPRPTGGVAAMILLPIEHSMESSNNYSTQASVEPTDLFVKQKSAAREGVAHV